MVVARFGERFVGKLYQHGKSADLEGDGRARDNWEMNNPAWKINGPASASRTIVLAHGAGAPMDSDFMEFVAQGLAERAIRVVRFEFPYMAERRESGKKKPPDRAPKLQAAWLDVIEQLGATDLVIGGKSMGGRIASLIADEAAVAGLVCLGYPFHPTGKPDRLRIEHLQDIQTATLILQGERDAFGKREEVERFSLAKSIHVHWLNDGDHSFKPRKASGVTQAENWTEAVEQTAQFVESL